MVAHPAKVDCEDLAHLEKLIYHSLLAWADSVGLGHLTPIETAVFGLIAIQEMLSRYEEATADRLGEGG